MTWSKLNSWHCWGEHHSQTFGVPSTVHSYLLTKAGDTLREMPGFSSWMDNACFGSTGYEHPQQRDELPCPEVTFRWILLLAVSLILLHVFCCVHGYLVNIIRAFSAHYCVAGIPEGQRIITHVLLQLLFKEKSSNSYTTLLAMIFTTRNIPISFKCQTNHFICISSSLTQENKTRTTDLETSFYANTSRIFTVMLSICIIPVKYTNKQTITLLQEFWEVTCRYFNLTYKWFVLKRTLKATQACFTPDL